MTATNATGQVDSTFCLSSPGLGEDPAKDGGIAWPYPHTIESALIRIFVHRVYRPDGTGTITDAEINGMLQQLNNAYSEFGVMFEEVGRDNVFAPTNAAYDQPVLAATSGGWDLGWVDEAPNAHAIDVYLFGADTEDSGGYSFVWSAGVDNLSLGVWGVDFPGSATADRAQKLIHEMGHCLSLRHTFECCAEGTNPLTWQCSCLDWPGFESDCAVLGDYVCDTPPDVIGDPSLFDPQNCDFSQTYYDYFATTGWNIDLGNFMAYHFPCADHFTYGQIDRMLSAIENDYYGLQAVVAPNKVAYSAPADPVGETGLNYQGTPYSSVVWDFDGVGLKDLFISVSGSDSKLFRGDDVTASGIPHFTPKDPLDFTGGAPQPGLRGTAVGDLDLGDNRTELFAAHATDSRLYTWDGTHIVNLAPSTGADAYGEVVAATWGDADGDSDLDLFLARAEGYVEEPPNIGSPKVTPASLILTNDDDGSGGREFNPTPGSGLPTNLYATSAAWADFDQDGDQDLFVGTISVAGAGGSKLFVNENGVFTDETATLLGATPIDKVVACGWEDMNNDGRLDLVLARYGAPAEIYYRAPAPAAGFDDGMGGTGPYVFGPEHGFSGMVLFDHDVDGRMDYLGLPNDDARSPMLFRNLPNPTPSLWEMRGAVGLDATGYVHGAVAEDFGGPGGVPDGLPDLYLGRPSTSGTFYYKADLQPGQTAQFTVVRLVGTAGVTSQEATGALVTVNSGPTTQVRQVDGGSLRGSQASRDLAFGLGDSSGPVTATIRWPGGLVQTDVPLLVNAVNTITDGAVAIDEGSVSASYVVQPSGQVDWKFNWHIGAPADPALHAVHFDMAGMPSQCQPGYAVITPATTGVTMTVVPATGGGYDVEMVLADQDCVPKCTIPYQVESGTAGQTDLSAMNDLRVRICTGS